MQTGHISGISSSDRDLQRRVANYLLQRQRRSLREVQIQVKDGVVSLLGRVGTFYEKQLCLSCCRRVAGVLELIDQIVVTLPGEGPGAAVGASDIPTALVAAQL